MDLMTFKLPETRRKNQSFLHLPASTSPGARGEEEVPGAGGMQSGEFRAQTASEGEEKS